MPSVAPPRSWRVTSFQAQLTLVLVRGNGGATVAPHLTAVALGSGAPFIGP